MKTRRFLLTTLCLATVACASDVSLGDDHQNSTADKMRASAPKRTAPTRDEKSATAEEPVATERSSSSKPSEVEPKSQATEPAKPAVMPFGPDAEVMPFTTDRLTLKAGEEKYLCFAKALDSDLVVNGFSTTRETFVHHLLVARVRAPEPEGFQDCGVSFRSTWEPMYISGVGDNKLEYPEDAGTPLKAGSQLLVQLHVLNPTEKPIEGAVTVHLRRSKAANPRPISGAVFGTGRLDLPPHKVSTVVGTCTLRQTVHMVAGFGHMHTLGTSIRFEAGRSESTMKEVFNLDPFSFDNQNIQKLDLTLNPGDITRTTCTYNNTTDETITYGESTLSEMCFFVSFAVDLPTQGGCLEQLPPNSFGL